MTRSAIRLLAVMMLLMSSVSLARADTAVLHVEIPHVIRLDVPENSLVQQDGGQAGLQFPDASPKRNGSTLVRLGDLAGRDGAGPGSVRFPESEPVQILLVKPESKTVLGTLTIGSEEQKKNGLNHQALSMFNDHMVKSIGNMFTKIQFHQSLTKAETVTDWGTPTVKRLNGYYFFFRGINVSAESGKRTYQKYLYLTFDGRRIIHVILDVYEGDSQFLLETLAVATHSFELLATPPDPAVIESPSLPSSQHVSEPSEASPDVSASTSEESPQDDVVDDTDDLADPVQSFLAGDNAPMIGWGLAVVLPCVVWLFTRRRSVSQGFIWSVAIVVFALDWGIFFMILGDGRGYLHALLIAAISFVVLSLSARQSSRIGDPTDVSALQFMRKNR